VGLIGAGTIGRAVADRIAAGEIPALGLGPVLGRGAAPSSAYRRALTIEELLESAVVVEAASHDAVRAYGEQVLAAGVSFVCLSVGALADRALRERLIAAGDAGGARLVIPSGAVGGLDLLRSAAAAGLESVVVEQRKPPAALLPTDEAAALEEPLTVFEGNVEQVVELFPTTTNVAAAVAIAGLGFERTHARVIADPALTANHVIVTARGAFGEFSLELRNVATANPRTSAIVASSVIAALRQLGGALAIPG
jgi:aspartate dehydrogenase